jgi:sporulation protein YlmC with PRC-barrel domain
MRSERTIHGTRLERLSRLDGFTVDRHEPDPRGWTVVNREGQRVGEVKDLIVDTERMTAPYRDVELDTKVFEFRGDDPHVLVPVERARADEKRLVVDDISSGWVADVRAARERHWQEFWDRWWHPADSVADDRQDRTLRVSPIRGADDPDELRRAIDQVRPGEEVRIPVVKEEIIVERRRVAEEPVVPDEVVVNRAADEPPRRR